MSSLTFGQAQRVVDRYLNALRRRDWAAIVELYAEEATLEDPVGSEPVVGREAIERFYRRALTQPILGELTVPLRVSGRAVAFPFRASAERGTTRHETDIIDVFHLDEQGLIHSMQAYWGPANNRQRAATG